MNRELRAVSVILLPFLYLIDTLSIASTLLQIANRLAITLTDSHSRNEKKHSTTILKRIKLLAAWEKNLSYRNSSNSCFQIM